MVAARKPSVKRISLFAAVVAAAIVAILVLGERPVGLYAETRLIMGTEVTVQVVSRSDEAAARAMAAGFAPIEMIDQRMSEYKDLSELMQMNRTAHRAPVRVSDDLDTVLAASLAMSEKTDGAFDVTCGPIVDLWKHAGRARRLPTQAERDDALRRTGFRKLHLDRQARTVRFDVEGMKVVLGAVAKGYAVDLSVKALQEAGHPDALVEAGGDLMAVGSAPGGRPWVVGVQDPRAETQAALIARLTVRDRAVVTSGNYRRFVEIDGRRYSHIVDPRTAWPVDALPSVTVVARDATTADALATAVSVLGLDEGMKLIEAEPDAEALLVTIEDGRLVLHRSNGFARYEAPAEAPRGE